MAAVQHVSLVQETNRPQVYLVCGGTKLWIPNPAEFDRVGFQWNRIVRVPLGALADLPERAFVGPAPVKPSSVFFDCGTNADTPIGKYYWNCQDSGSLIRHDVLVAGWLVDAPWANVQPHGTGCEDVHYNISLDPDFVQRMYGRGGLSTALNGQLYRGNPRTPPPNPALSVEETAGGTSIGVTFNSFILPGNDYDIHGELNAWHVNDTGDLFHAHFKGRGPAPSGWRQITVGTPHDDTRPDTDAWFPFDIYAPHGEFLRQGDYVLMRGSLWQDGDHRAASLWDEGPTRHHSGWVEIHPVDWIVRLQPRPPSQHATVRRLALCTPLLNPAEIGDAFEIMPSFAPSRPSRRLTVASVATLRDGRMTVPASVARDDVVDGGNVVRVSAAVKGLPSGQGRLKASYVVRWRETDANDVVWINDELPAGAREGVTADDWAWVSSNPPPFFGSRAHQSRVAAGVHQHYFTGATEALSVGEGETLFCHVYLDPTQAPTEVMLQWYDGSWEHRAYWGANSVPWGTDGTTSRAPMGPLPETAAWIRLEVPAARVGLANRVVSGIAFTLFDGRATWDYAGKLGAIQDAIFVSQAVPKAMAVGEEVAVSVTVRNSGSLAWKRAANHRLGSQNPPDTMRWGLSRLDLPRDVVAPGEQATFQFAVTPPLRPSTYAFQWRMVQEGVAWFGAPTPKANVRVFREPTD